MTNKLLNLDWSDWLYGLLHATIGGMASSGLGWMGMAGAHGAGVDVPILNWKALGILLVSGAVPSFFLYLKQSPLPTLVSEKTTTVTETVTEKLTNETPLAHVDPPKP